MSRTRHERPRRRTPGSTTSGKKPSEGRWWAKRNMQPKAKRSEKLKARSATRAAAASPDAAARSAAT